MDLPSKFGLSGKNSASVGRTHPCFRMMGFTNEATRCNMGKARSDLGMSLRWVKDLTNVSIMLKEGSKFRLSRAASALVALGRCGHGADASNIGERSDQAPDADLVSVRIAYLVERSSCRPEPTHNCNSHPRSTRAAGNERNCQTIQSSPISRIMGLPNDCAL